MQNNTKMAKTKNISKQYRNVKQTNEHEKCMEQNYESLTEIKMKTKNINLKSDSKYESIN